MILGITGGTGAGKTPLSDQIRGLGGLVLDCDAIYHRLLREDAALLGAISSQFPGTVEDGVLNRKKLGALVFSDPIALEDLNRITHAAIKEEVLRLLRNSRDLSAIDAIALFESGLASLCQVTVAVTAPEEDRIRRLMVRDGISEEYARARIAAQHNDRWFRERCDHCLENSGQLDAFATNCLAFLQGLGIMKENK